MKKLSYMLLCLVVWCAPGVAATPCSDYSNERLLSIMSSLAMVSEELYAASGVRSAEFETNMTTFRDMLADEDEALLMAACDMVARFPSIEPALQQSIEDLRSTGAIDQLAGVQRMLRTPEGVEAGGTVCLTDQAHDAVRATLFVIRIALIALQSTCDTLGCVFTACTAPCIFIIPSAILEAPFEATLTASAFNCGSDHYDEMTAFYETVIGFGGRGSTPTLMELESMVTNQVLPTIQSGGANVAQQDLLLQSRDDLQAHVQETQDQISAIDASVITDAMRRVDYQQRSERIAIETQLSPGAQSAPITLQVPASAGGQLETVREIVADAISDSRDAGIPINQALSFFNLGDTALNQGKYISAFESYRDAYRELLQ